VQATLNTRAAVIGARVCCTAARTFVLAATPGEARSRSEATTPRAPTAENS